MAENMMCSNHKSTNKVFRDGYDRIFRNNCNVDKVINDKECTCNERYEPHPCPYQEDVWDNHDPEYCTCCPYCTDECAANI